MAQYRNRLPQLSDKLFLSDGGLETTLVFHDGLELPYFAAFDLLKDDEGTARLRDYFMEYAAIARHHGLGFILESPTWRASSDWGARLGYSDNGLDRMNLRAVELLMDIRHQVESDETPCVISGCIGPRGDGYQASETMTPAEAEAYHGRQIRSLRRAGADLVSAFTINTATEATGITRAARAADIPAVISFTLETDGRLPSGEQLGDAIEQVDQATDGGPAYYMINCAHPTHFRHVLDGGAAWLERIRGVRANASCKSHAELDASETLDDGDPVDLGDRYREMRHLMKNLNILGGCCGTDHRHVEAIAEACAIR